MAHGAIINNPYEKIVFDTEAILTIKLVGTVKSGHILLTGSITLPVYTNKINEFPMKMSHEIDMAHLVKLLYINWSILSLIHI